MFYKPRYVAYLQKLDVDIFNNTEFFLITKNIKG